MFKGKMFVSLSILGALSVIGLLIYFDDDLRERANAQVSKVLDTTEKMVNTIQEATGTAPSDESQTAVRQEEALNQWAHIAR